VPENGLPSVAEMFVAVAAIAWSEIARLMQKLQAAEVVGGGRLALAESAGVRHRNEYGLEPETITWSTGRPSE